MPAEVIKAKCARHMRRGKPDQRPGLMNEQDHAIISRYGSEYRGIVQYYLLAGDVWRLNRLHWVMLTSLLKTLAGKHGSSVSKMARKYAATIETPHGPRKCMQVTRRARRGPQATGRNVRWYPAQTAEQRGPARPRTDPGDQLLAGS